MRVLMLTWEYPPVSVGGLARHVRYLSLELARRGHLVDVVSQGARDGPEAEEEAVEEGLVRVWRRTAYTLSSPDFLHWVHQLNYSFLEAVMGLAARSAATDGPFDIIHAHDWLAAFAARAAKHAYRVPLVATVHATEAGRHGGIHNPWQRYISEVEWWLTYEAWRVICCSDYMESELSGQFQLPPDKIRVIPNGVDPADVDPADVDPADAGPAGLRREVFAEPGEDIVLYVGRLVQEKGVDTLLDAAPAVLDRRPATRFVVCGTGPTESHLRWRAAKMGLGDRVRFTGYLDDRGRNHLYRWASVAVVPSYYEPFGLTALEAMAAGTPVVVSDTGGLGEIVTHGEVGLKVPPANPGELAAAVLRLLDEPAYGRRLAARAREMVATRYSWRQVAWETEAVYEEVVRAAEASGWSGGALSGQGRASEGEDWERARQRTRVMTRGQEPIGRYNPPT